MRRRRRRALPPPTCSLSDEGGGDDDFDDDEEARLGGERKAEAEAEAGWEAEQDVHVSMGCRLGGVMHVIL